MDITTITARNIRTFRHSPAFELTLHIDGKPAATVSNDGRGGCHRWAPTDGNYRAVRALRDRIDAAVTAATGWDLEAADIFASALADGARDGAHAIAWIKECA